MSVCVCMCVRALLVCVCVCLKMIYCPDLICCSIYAVYIIMLRSIFSVFDFSVLVFKEYLFYCNIYLMFYRNDEPESKYFLRRGNKVVLYLAVKLFSALI